MAHRFVCPRNDRKAGIFGNNNFVTALYMSAHKRIKNIEAWQMSLQSIPGGNVISTKECYWLG